MGVRFMSVKGKSNEKTDTVKSLDDHLSGCIKFVSKDYVCYRRDWLYEHLDEEFALLKRCKDMKLPSREEIEKLLNECEEMANGNE